MLVPIDFLLKTNCIFLVQESNMSTEMNFSSFFEEVGYLLHSQKICHMIRNAYMISKMFIRNFKEDFQIHNNYIVENFDVKNYTKTTLLKTDYHKPKLHGSNF